MALAREMGKRLLSLVLVLFLVTMFTALLLSMVPGDPVDTLVPLASSEQADQIKAQVREDLDLDEPLPTRYVNWVSDFTRPPTSSISVSLNSCTVMAGARKCSDWISIGGFDGC